jgi:FixJ family two-component response regulator
MSEAPLIAIVDDDELARDGMREFVESLGYAAATFTSAEHFLQSAVIAQATCLITDLKLPGQSGLELQEALRSRGYQMPVILVTAYPNDKHQTRALNNGAVGFLSKPFDDRWLMECLTDAIKLNDKAVPAVARRAANVRYWIGIAHGFATLGTIGFEGCGIMQQSALCRMSPLARATHESCFTVRNAGLAHRYHQQR